MRSNLGGVIACCLRICMLMFQERYLPVKKDKLWDCRFHMCRIIQSGNMSMARQGQESLRKSWLVFLVNLCNATTKGLITPIAVYRLLFSIMTATFLAKISLSIFSLVSYLMNSSDWSPPMNKITRARTLSTMTVPGEPDVIM